MKIVRTLYKFLDAVIRDWIERIRNVRSNREFVTKSEVSASG